MNYQNFAEKYRIKKTSEFIGQDKAVIDLKQFLKEFPKKKAAILYGPAGTGKTSLALALTKENDLEVLELNSSDLRNKKKLEEVLRPAATQKSLFKKGKIILMDEVDGVTGTDIGGIPEILRVLEVSEYPIIMTCNDVWQSKISPVRSKSKLIEMKALPIAQIIQILQDVNKKEKLGKSLDFLQQLAIKSQGDVRAALNDMQSYSLLENVPVDREEKRSVEESIFNILKVIFKDRGDFLEIFDSTELTLDEILLWIEENIPREYKNEALANAYYALGKADVFRGRIYRNQSWRFLIYQNIFQSAGISYSKQKATQGFTKYEPPKRILKIWIHNNKTAKKKSIAKKYARLVHCSVKRAMRDFELLKPIIKNEDIQKQLKLSEEEMGYLAAK